VAKQARELGFKGGFVIIDQAKMDEMAKVIGGYGPLEGAIGVLPFPTEHSQRRTRGQPETKQHGAIFRRRSQTPFAGRRRGIPW
jgi:hypothetical protein